MDRAPSRERDRELTREAFDLLLARLAPGREEAGERYEAVRRKLVRFFAWWGSECPEDHADQTINRVVRKVAGGEEIGDIDRYFVGVARLVYAEHVKGRVKDRAALEHLTRARTTAEDSRQSEARHDCYEQCLRGLPEPSRELVTRYYREEQRRRADQRQELAEQLGIPLNRLRIRAFRIRNALKDCVRDCLKERQSGDV